jgi:hypothetical protein
MIRGSFRRIEYERRKGMHSVLEDNCSESAYIADTKDPMYVKNKQTGNTAAYQITKITNNVNQITQIR